MIESKLEETLWKKNCEFLFNLFIELQSTMIDQYREKLGMLHDLAFLEYFDKFWSSMRLYTHWNLTLLNPVEGYAKLFKSKTLLQATLEQLRVVVLSFNDKLSTSLLRQLHDLRNGNDVNSLMLARLFKAFFEVDYEGKSKIVKIGDKFLYNYDEKMGLKPHEYDKKAPEKQKTTTFCQCIKEKLLAESKAFYSKKVQEWIGLTVPDFLDTANTYLQKEAELIDLYYSYEKADIWACITEQVIVKTANTIVSNNETGLLYLLNEKKLRYIKILYDFLDRINHPLENLTAHFLDYIQKSVEGIKNKSVEEMDQDAANASPSGEVEDIIEFKQEVVNTCNDCFKKNKAIINSARLEMQRAFAKVDDFPKKLAAYVDDFMLKNGKNLDNEEIIQHINEIFDIIALTTERDKFLYYYEQALKSRLLSINNYNEAIESDFLKRLNQVMGEQQIIRIKGMIQDIVNSKKLNSDLATYMTSKKSKYPSLRQDVANIYLLTKSSWPKEVLETETCQIPDDLAEYVTCFNDYFEKQNPGQTKVVDWLLEEGYIEVATTLGKSKKMLILTVGQYSILTALAKEPDMKMTYAHIKEATKVKKMLGALGPMVSKKLLLRENPDIKQKIEENEFLSINPQFQAKTREVNFIVRKTLKNRASEGDKDKIDENRKVMIEAAIVKNMKSKKVSKFHDLATDVRRLLQDHFQPPDNLLRIMIDNLIRREFLERDENDMNVYIYKA